MSGDLVGIEEIINGVDQHRENQILFKLPGWDVQDKEDDRYKQGRLTAKVFIFRMIFGGTAYSYANDADFTSVSKSEKFWQDVIDKTYYKYKGLAQWHKDLLQQAQKTGVIRLPTGREFKFSPEKGYNGDLKYPVTKIKNYPVQGLSADIVQIARVSAWRRLRDKGLFINTVHDSIVMDVKNDPQLCYEISCELEQVFKDVPKNMEKIYGYKMKVPMAGEVTFGNNLDAKKEFKRELGVEQFKEVV